MKESSIKVGVITDQTGALSFMGIANANVAKMVIHDINAKGGGIAPRQIVGRKPKLRSSSSKIK